MICKKKTDNKWKIAGIFSWLTECGHPKRPAVFVNVPYYRKWIDNNIKKSRFDTNFHVYLEFKTPAISLKRNVCKISFRIFDKKIMIKSTKSFRKTHFGILLPFCLSLEISIFNY